MPWSRVLWGFRSLVLGASAVPSSSSGACEVDLMHVADGIDLIFRYQRLWTVDKMRRVAPIAVLILGLIQDLQKVCQTNNWLFEDRAPFLAYKVDLLLRRQQLPGLRGTTLIGYKRCGCAPHRTQDLMVQLQEYYRPGESTEPYAYNAVAPRAPIDLVLDTELKSDNRITHCRPNSDRQCCDHFLAE